MAPQNLSDFGCAMKILRWRKGENRCTSERFKQPWNLIRNVCLESLWIHSFVVDWALPLGEYDYRLEIYFVDCSSDVDTDMIV